ncbi:hypothetical protein [Yinghuangia sp. YIM S09857]|uniref:hypothetical protein n=1 Tax=Yinghuangia sp. YIM S09857 TaxID=3436929 RepID=UPI003F53E03D
MGDDAGRARDFEEPAFPRGPRGRVRAEPPLRVGRWTDYGDNDGDGASEESAPESGPEHMVEAAVPRARGARRVLPGEPDPGDGGEDRNGHTEDDETTVRVRPARSVRTTVGAPEVIAGRVEEAAPRVSDHWPEEEDEQDVPEVEEEEDEEEGDSGGDVGDFFAKESPEPAGHPDSTDPWRNSGHAHAAAGSAEYLSYATHQEPMPQVSAYSYAYPGFAAASDPTPSAAMAPIAVQTEPASGQLELRRGRHTAGDGSAAEPLALDLVNDSEVRPARTPFEVAVLLGAPALALTALLYYFGWARSAAMADFLGIDADVLGYTTREYLLRSVDTLYRPILAVVGVLLAARMVHPHVLVRLRRHRRAAARLSWVLRCAWFAVPAATWTALFKWPGKWPLFWPLLLPCALTAGVLVSAYGVLLSRQLGTHRRATGMGVRPWSLSVVLTSAAVVLCLFWTLGAYAQADGQAAALRVVKTLPARTAVVVYSAQDLRVAAEQGVTAEALSGRESPYRFRYAGLRLLRRAEGRLFLLPDRWAWDRPRLIVVREDSGVRVEYLRSR